MHATVRVTRAVARAPQGRGTKSALLRKHGGRRLNLKTFTSARLSVRQFHQSTAARDTTDLKGVLQALASGELDPDVTKQAFAELDKAHAGAERTPEIIADKPGYFVYDETFTRPDDAKEVPEYSLKGDTISGEYALALFRMAYRFNLMERVEEDIEKLEYCFKESPDVVALFEADEAFIGAETRAKTIDKLRQELQLCSLFNVIFNWMVTYNDTHVMRGVLEDYREVLNLHSREFAFEVTTAKPLTPEESEFIGNTICRDYLTPGDYLRMREVVNPDIVGGQVLKTAQDTFDFSVQKSAKDYLARLAAEGEKVIKEKEKEFPDVSYDIGAHTFAPLRF